MDIETDRNMYTKEELAKRVKVPAEVEQDLKRIISELLEQCGIYFRVFSRIKTAASMARKFEQKSYNEDHKLQDLIGVRINLYFDDDVEICKELMEKIFDVIGWSFSERSEDEFKPTKMNGVFRLPRYLRAMISPDTWEMNIDDTFEIQVKTIFFEGWHEIEHDMRYKGEELWKDYGSFSRYLNSILATLELCDKSMVTLFEDLGHALYKSCRWSDMIKSHFRVKLGDVQIYPEVETFLDEDHVSGQNVAKLIYKTPKVELIRLMAKKSRKIPVNVNTIIALLNDAVFHNNQLTAIFRERDVYNDGREGSVAESRHYELRPLVRHTIFQMSTEVDGNRLRKDRVSVKEVFQKTADSIYRWIVLKYGSVFPKMPQETCSWHSDTLAYHVSINYRADEMRMNAHVRHLDLDIGGRIWYCEASVYPEGNDTIRLKVNNGYAEPVRDYQISDDVAGSFFSYPGFYRTIVDNIGIRSGLECANRRRILREEGLADFERARTDPSRVFPLVVIISKESPDGMMDENWLDEFRVSDFIRTVWRYAHVFTCYEETGRKLLAKAYPEGDRPDAVPGLYIFWPDGTADSYGPEDVKNCSFGRHQETRGDLRVYDFVRGGQAFYHRIVAELRDRNMNTSVWEGFQLDIQTEIPE